MRFYKLLQILEFPVRGNFKNNIRLKKPELKRKEIREIALFDYITWDRKLVKEVITKQGWRKPTDAFSTWRTDCKLGIVVSYCFHNLFGCSKNCVGYHNMINENQMSRAEALAQEENTSATFTPELEEFLSHEVGLTAKDIKKIKSFRKN